MESDDQLGDHIFFPRLHADTPTATANLLLVNGDRRTFEIAGLRNSHGDLFIGDQVFQLQLGGLIDDLGAAHVAKVFAHCLQFLDDQGAQLRFRGKDRFVFGNVGAYFG